MRVYIQGGWHWWYVEFFPYVYLYMFIRSLFSIPYERTNPKSHRPVRFSWVKSAVSFSGLAPRQITNTMREV